jgi:hypothetical protein
MTSTTAPLQAARFLPVVAAHGADRGPICSTTSQSFAPEISQVIGTAVQKLV